MKLGKEFIKSVRDACLKKLTDIGMRKRSGGIATIEVADGFTGWVGLNEETQRYDGCMRINLNVGLRYDPAHKLIAEIYGQKPHAYIPPTISENVGYLVPGRDSYIQFTFRPTEPIEPKADELANIVKQYGLPYMKKYAEIKALISQIRKDAIWDYSGELMLATSYVSGASPRELHRIIDERKAIATKKKFNDQPFVDFSKKFLEYVESQTSIT